MKARSLVLGLVGLVSAVVGCGGGGAGAGSGPAGPTPQVMAEVAELLGAYSGSNKNPPTKAADFIRYEAMASDAVRFIQNGDIVYAWGNAIKPGSTAVLAYPKDAAEKGGPVLLQDGTVKSMTAAEFATAPKAVKK